MLILEIAGGRVHEFSIDECAGLMSRQNKVKSWLKLAGLFGLLIAFGAGTNNLISRICAGGDGLGILLIIQLAMSLTLVGYLISYLKISIERYIYGGLKLKIGEIYFQSEKERALFEDITQHERRNTDD